MCVCVCVCVQLFSHVWLFMTPWTVAGQAPLSMGFFQERIWSGLPFPPPGNLSNPGIKPASHALASRFFTTEPTGSTYLLYSNLVHANSWLIGKDSDAGRDWGQQEKGMTEDEMAGWHHWLDGRESEWTLGVGDGHAGLVCCDSWGRKESDMTERLNWTELNWSNLAAAAAFVANI